jgi:hypothetical protein
MACQEEWPPWLGWPLPFDAGWLHQHDPSTDRTGPRSARWLHQQCLPVLLQRLKPAPA